MRCLSPLEQKVAIATLAVLGATGCANSHESIPDTGPPTFDLGPWIVDGGPEARPPLCSSEGGCPEGLTCEQDAICLVYERMGVDTNSMSYPICIIARPDGDDRHRATFTGEPCGLATPDSPMGIGLPLDICLGLSDPDLWRDLRRELRLVGRAPGHPACPRHRVPGDLPDGSLHGRVPDRALFLRGHVRAGRVSRSHLQ